MNSPFTFKLCTSYNTPLFGNGYEIQMDQYNEMNRWLYEHIGVGNYNFGFEDYGQHGEWMLYTRSSADLLAFKLRWCDR